MLRKISSLSIIFILFLTACGTASSTLQPVASTIATATQATVPMPATPEGTEPAANAGPAVLSYPLVDTGQGKCYDNLAEIPCPADGDFFGQDAQYTGLQPSLSLNDDGTITDKNTGLIWQNSPDVDGDGKINAADKLSFAAAGDYCKTLSPAGKWRLPDIKTLYSLIDFRGTDPSGASGQVNLIPFLDSTYFDFAYGDTSAGERTIDAQFVSSSQYVDKKGADGGKVFGVNFADGRIKGYGLTAASGNEQKFFVLCVRGDSAYGVNHFVDNSDGTVSDQATGLVWQQADSAQAMDWKAALAYCEDLSLAGAEDWRLPDAKSLQSLVDYSRSPATSNSSAIDPLFSSSLIKNELGMTDYPYYWTSTTLADWDEQGANAVYIAFGRAMGYMNSTWVDVHGAGSQRSDPKTGESADYPTGRGPQGDAVRILNYARCVRGGDVTPTPQGNPKTSRPSIPVQVNNPIPSGPGAPDGGGGGGGTPSPEAIAACSGKSAGDSCSFVLDILGEFHGTCQLFDIPGILHELGCVPNLP